MATTLKVAEAPASLVSATGCVLIVSGVFTVTTNVPLAVFPTLSVAVAVTVVVPTAKVPPLTGEYVMVGVPMLSVALAPLNVTLAPLPDVALTLTLPPTLSTGAVVSTTPPPDSVPLSKITSGGDGVACGGHAPREDAPPL